MNKGAIHSMQRLFPLAFLCALSAGAHADAVNRCARYGADYAPVSGSNGCVRLGGHVRVDQMRDQARIEPGRPQQQTVPAPPPMSYVARDGFLSASARMAQQPLAPFELFRR